MTSFKKSLYVIGFFTFCFFIFILFLNFSNYNNKDIVENKNELKIAAFNIQIFGVSKMKRDGVPLYLSSIINRYDVVFIQEIRDKSGLAIKNLLALVNKNNKGKYKLHLSKRLGKSKSKEQYAFIYNTRKLEILDSALYKDYVVFERFPYAVNFKYGKKEIVIAGIHVDPDNVLTEMNLLDDSLEFFKKKFNNDNLLLLGDMNADCGYLNNSEKKLLDLNRLGYISYIADDVDTTVSPTNCAYDRIYSSINMQKYVIDSGVFNFRDNFLLTLKQADRISDHYPVYINLKYWDFLSIFCYFIKIIIIL